MSQPLQTCRRMQRNLSGSWGAEEASGSALPTAAVPKSQDVVLLQNRVSKSMVVWVVHSDRVPRESANETHCSDRAHHSSQRPSIP